MLGAIAFFYLFGGAILGVLGTALPVALMTAVRRAGRCVRHQRPRRAVPSAPDALGSMPPAPVSRSKVPCPLLGRRGQETGSHKRKGAIAMTTRCTSRGGVPVMV
jgi:hypothetical protein